MSTLIMKVVKIRVESIIQRDEIIVALIGNGYKVWQRQEGECSMNNLAWHICFEIDEKDIENA